MLRKGNWDGVADLLILASQVTGKVHFRWKGLYGGALSPAQAAGFAFFAKSPQVPA
jgi:hypothetical protein